MFTLYQKSTQNLVMTISVSLLFFTLIASSISSPLVLAQLSEDASTDVDNNTSNSPYSTGQGNFENSIDSSFVSNYSFPVEQSQQDLSLPLSDFPSSGMDFNKFIDSFANSIFNGTSVFGGLGTSMVEGVRVSGIALNNNGTLSVTLSGSPTGVLGINGTANITNHSVSATTNQKPSNSVSVIATRIPINMADILSLAAASSSQGMNDNDSMMTGDDMGFNQDSIFPSDSFNPFSLLSSLQMGSSSITNTDWSIPQTVTMDLVGGGISSQAPSQSYSNNTLAADFLLVSVIPYTGIKG
jgi:hypothetical protein